MGPYKSHRESLGGLPETPAGEEAQGEEGPAATQLDVSRLRSSSMEIREKGSEFLKEELHKAQKVGTEGGARHEVGVGWGKQGGWGGVGWDGVGGDKGPAWEPQALTQHPEMSPSCQGHLHARPVLSVRAGQFL